VRNVPLVGRDLNLVVGSFGYTTKLKDVANLLGGDLKGGSQE